jgi:hypothetical protein
MTTGASQRRYDLDWLRVLVILVVFVFHCGRFFDTDGWHVKNPVRHPTAQLWTVFLVCWMMPLIFVISGASTFYALGKGTGKFVKDRASRLLVPVVAGIFSHIAWQVYLERVSFSGFNGSFLQFYALLPRLLWRQREFCLDGIALVVSGGAIRVQPATASAAGMVQNRIRPAVAGRTWSGVGKWRESLRAGCSPGLTHGLSGSENLFGPARLRRLAAACLSFLLPVWLRVGLKRITQQTN